MKMGCCRCGCGSGCWFRDQQRSQDRKGLLGRGGGEERGWFTDFHGREGGRHGLGIKPTALGFVGPKLSLPVGPVCHSLSLFEVKEREREKIIMCVRQYGLRVLSPGGVSCARGQGHKYARDAHLPGSQSDLAWEKQ